MATRRIGEAVFDHGAQYFTVRTQPFQDLVESWMEAHVAREWARGFSHADAYNRQRGTIRAMWARRG
jgi:predicted NAD/FAD-dependent oxidoreductase